MMFGCFTEIVSFGNTFFAFFNRNVDTKNDQNPFFILFTNL